MTGYFISGVPMATVLEAAVLLLGSAPEPHPA